MILYAVTAVYFAGVMVRLMLTLTPVVCVLAGIAFSHTYEKFMVDDGESSKKNGDNKDDKSGLLFLNAETNARALYNFDFVFLGRLYDKAAKTTPRGTAAWSNSVRPSTSENEEHVGMNTRSIVSIIFLFILLMYVAHCTF